jgi:hypothetical protein
MVKMAKTGLRTICAVMLGFGIGNIITYTTSPQIKHADLLESEAAIIQEYHGKSPAEEIDDALKILGYVAAENPKYQEEFSRLEQELTGIRDGIEQVSSEQIYTPVMESAGEKLATFASDHSKPVSKLYAAGIDFCIAAMAGVGMAVTRDDD